MPSATIEYTVIAVYLVILIAVGAVFRQFNKDVSDYFRNGCRGTWWLVGSSAFMTQFSAWTFSGAASAAYDAGWSVMAIFFGNSAGYAMNALFIAPWFRQLRAMTSLEVLRLRFGPGTQQFIGWFGFLVAPFYSALTLLSLGIFTASAFDLPLQSVIVGVGVVVIVYSLMGGSWAVTATDFLQTLILVPITLLVAVLCLTKLGGVGALFQAIDQQGLTADYQFVNPPGQFPPNLYTKWWIVAMVAQQIIFLNSLFAASRYFLVKDGAEAKKAAWLAFALMTAGALIWFIPPMTSRLLWSAQVAAMPIANPAESSYAVAAVNLLPRGLIGVMVVAMFAATMSTNGYRAEPVCRRVCARPLSCALPQVRLGTAVRQSSACLWKGVFRVSGTDHPLAGSVYVTLRRTGHI